MQSKEGRGWSRSWTQLPGHQGTRGVSLILARPGAPTDPVPWAGPPAKCLLQGRVPQGLLISLSPKAGTLLGLCTQEPADQRSRGAGSRRNGPPLVHIEKLHTVHHACIQVTPELRCPGLAAWRTWGGTECYREDGWFGQVWVLLHSQAPAGGPWTWAGQCLVVHLGCSKANQDLGAAPAPRSQKGWSWAQVGGTD